MSKDEIKQLIAENIAGQGNQIDISGKLATILNEIVDNGGGNNVLSFNGEPEYEDDDKYILTTSQEEQLKQYLGITDINVEQLQNVAEKLFSTTYIFRGGLIYNAKANGVFDGDYSEIKLQIDNSKYVSIIEA